MLSAGMSKMLTNTNKFDLKTFLGGKEEGRIFLTESLNKLPSVYTDNKPDYVDGLDGGGFFFLSHWTLLY